MKLVSNTEELDALIQKYFVKGTITNNYILTEDYLNYIHAGELFVISTASNLGFFLRKNGFYRLYYFINDPEEIMHIAAEWPVTMEILYRGEENRPVEVMNFWRKCGFTDHLSRDCMAAAPQQVDLPAANNPAIKLKYADSEAEIIFTKELLENTLDEFTGDILSYEEVKAFADKKNIICAYLEDKPCAALQFEIKNNVVWLGHIAVASGFRGKGIARELVRAYISDNAHQPKTRFQLWVIQNNSAARTLYEKFGFIYANKSTVSMIKY
jgi:GNAT superfamily N-acetyltransferase